MITATLAEKLFGPASIHIGSIEVEAPTIVVILVLVVLLWSLIWLYCDAKKRNKNGFLAILFLITAWPASIVWWLWLRPSVAQKK